MDAAQPRLGSDVRAHVEEAQALWGGAVRREDEVPVRGEEWAA